MPLKEDMAYIAGLFDGEGSVGASRSRAAMNLRVYIQIAMCDRVPVDFVASVLGGKVSELKRRTGSGKAVYQWALHCNKAADALEKIIPYLRLKKERAESAVKLARMMRHTGKKEPFTEAEISERFRLGNAIKTANARGNARCAGKVKLWGNGHAVEAGI